MVTRILRKFESFPALRGKPFHDAIVRLHATGIIEEFDVVLPTEDDDYSPGLNPVVVAKCKPDKLSSVVSLLYDHHVESDIGNRTAVFEIPSRVDFHKLLNHKIKTIPIPQSKRGRVLEATRYIVNLAQLKLAHLKETNQEEKQLIQERINATKQRIEKLAKPFKP